MNDKTCFKVRLATALFSLLLALELFLVNLREYEIPPANPFVETVTNGQGWPFCGRKVISGWGTKTFDLIYTGLLLDVLVAGSICATAAIAFNLMLRRLNQKQEPPKRSLLQLHLLTAVLLALGAGALLWLNVLRSPGENMPDILWQSSTVQTIFKSVQGDEGRITIEQQYGWIGWPITFRRLIRLNGVTYTAMFYDSLLIDCGVALNAILGIALVSEYLIRRREARRQ